MPAKPRRPKSSKVRLTWRHARLEITHTRDYFDEGQDHLEVRVRSPKGAPIPITETGYRSEFTTHQAVEDAGGPAGYIRAWLDREASTKAWVKREFAWRQLELDLLPPCPRPRRSSEPAKAAGSRRRIGQGSA